MPITPSRPTLGRARDGLERGVEPKVNSGRNLGCRVVSFLFPSQRESRGLGLLRLQPEVTTPESRLSLL